MRACVDTYTNKCLHAHIHIITFMCIYDAVPQIRLRVHCSTSAMLRTVQEDSPLAGSSFQVRPLLLQEAYFKNDFHGRLASSLSERGSCCSCGPGRSAAASVAGAVSRSIGRCAAGTGGSSPRESLFLSCSWILSGTRSGFSIRQPNKQTKFVMYMYTNLYMYMCMYVCVYV